MTQNRRYVELKPQPGPQTTFLSTHADIAIYGGAAGGGKVQENQALIATPWGFKEIGTLNVGDWICDPFGGKQKVIQIHPHKDWKFYNVTFNDGSVVECGMEHLWVAWKAREISKRSENMRKGGFKEDPFSLFPSSARVHTLETLKKWLDKGIHPLIPVTKPVRFNVTSREKDRPHPYLIGMMIGDGCMSSEGTLGFTNIDMQLVDYVAGLLNTHWDGKKQLNIRKSKNEWFIQKLKDYKLLGTVSNSKFIPERYLTESIDNRVELLQGLMDTDGYVDERGHLEYCTVSNQLASDVKFLVESLGGWVTITKRVGSYRNDEGEKVECQTANYLYIRLPDEIVPFKLKRKVDRLIPNKGRLYRTIVSIEPSRVSNGRCITVDHPSSLYLTNNFIVTHNSFALLLEPLRHLENSRFSAVIFRKTMPQIRNEGGLWDESVKMYPQVGGVPLESKLKWEFPSGMTVRFSYLEYDKDVNQWQGSQVPLLGFDELVHFSEHQFTYMMSRLRSDSGVHGYIRATCNPEADTWVRRWIDWYIGKDGLPIKERSGVIRWFYRLNNDMHWADSKQELIDKFGESVTTKVKSFTFIPAKLSDNKALMEMDPGYEANLEAQSRVERERLLEGNWDVRAQDGRYFDRATITEVDSYPTNLIKKTIRYWDRAATEPNEVNKDPDYTVGLKMGKSAEGNILILGMERFRKGPFEVKRRILETRERDGKHVEQYIEQDPGASGKSEAFSLRRAIADGGYICKTRTVTKDKLTRFLPFSATAETKGEIILVRNTFHNDEEQCIEAFYKELEYFSGDGKTHDDIVDCCSGGYSELENMIDLGNFDLGSMSKENSFGNF